jgi:hypothetical protein
MEALPRSHRGVTTRYMCIVVGQWNPGRTQTTHRRAVRTISAIDHFASVQTDTPDALPVERSFLHRSGKAAALCTTPHQLTRPGLSCRKPR